MDPALSAILAALPSGAAGTPQESRAQARAYTEMMGLDAPDRDRLHISERAIPGPGGDLRVRIYEPPERVGPSPAIVYFHGGGFIAGDLDTEDGRCVRIAADAGCVVVSVEYRLAPEHPFPAPVDDCYAALEWTVAAAPELGLDPTRIGVGGGSAGGTIAAAVALMARDRGGPAIAFQLLVYPALDDRQLTPSSQAPDRPVVNAEGVRRLWDHYVGTDRSNVSPYAAPARADDLTGLPPAYVMTAELDALRDEGIEFALRLLRSGVSVDVRHYGETFHGFDLMPSTISRHALDDQATWVRTITQH